MQLIDSKSILAKLMATENLVVEQRNVRTASFDVKNRILTLPILDKNISSHLYDLLTGHEVGHALYTPEEGMRKAMNSGINMSIVNVVEDSRIERKIKYKYPGLRSSFLKGYSELIEKNFFETRGQDLNNYNLIDRINLHCKGGAAQNIHFTPEERILLKEVESTETYDQVIDISKKLSAEMERQEQEKLKKLAEELKKFGQDEEPEEEDFDSYDGDFEDYEDFEDYDNPRNFKNSEDEKQPQYTQDGSTGNDDSGEDGEVTDSEEIKGRGVYDNDEQVEDKMKSFTDEAFKRNEQRLVDNGDREYVYVEIPKVNLKEYVMDHKVMYRQYKEGDYGIDRNEFAKIRRDANKVVSYLVKEFEMRKNADQLKRASTAKTGDLNLSKIFSYQFSEDIFKKITVVPGGKSHGLVIFLDWSGSMSNHIFNTVKQLINLVMFCKKVNIPFEVYSFVDHDDHSRTKTKPEYKKLRVDRFKLVNILSSRMSAGEFLYAGSALTYIAKRPHYSPHWMHMSGTPLNSAIITAMELVPEFQKQNKLQVVNTVFLTDGESCSNRVYYDKNDQGEIVESAIYRYGVKQTSMVIRDPVTKNQVVVEDSQNGKAMTAAFIKLLKYRTNSNIVGFYILYGREFNSQAYCLFPQGINIEEMKLKFRKEKSMVITSEGFDEYYYLRSESMDTHSDAEFEVRENVTTRGLVSAFTKYTGNRVSNRVVLNRFIGMVV